ncbi:MAG: bis(5'-nucleosyl)-tetraphosphatase (symmetrical) YqeK [Vulcanibacillus sp.]
MEIGIDFYKDELKKQVSNSRYLHSLGVANCAKILAVRFGADPEKTEIAGILHDYCKDLDKEELIRIIEETDELPNDLLEYNDEIWHGPVASVIIKEKFNITDEEIINSIRHHTSGRRNMSLIEKIVCLADYIEPNRKFEGVDKIRILAEKDLEKALLATLDGTIRFLLEKKMKIYYLTFEARNCLIDEIAKK